MRVIQLFPPSPITSNNDGDSCQALRVTPGMSWGTVDILSYLFFMITSWGGILFVPARTAGLRHGLGFLTAWLSQVIFLNSSSGLQVQAFHSDKVETGLPSLLKARKRGPYPTLVGECQVILQKSLWNGRFCWIHFVKCTLPHLVSSHSLICCPFLIS